MPAAEPDNASSSTDEATGLGASVDLLNGTRSVDIQTYGDEWVTTTVEGGIQYGRRPCRKQVASPPPGLFSRWTTAASTCEPPPRPTARTPA